MKQTKPREIDRHWNRHAWRLAALWIFLLAAYSNSFQSGLVFDNVTAITGDPRIREATAHNIRLILTQDYWYHRETSGLYRPVTTLSYLANYAVFGNHAQPAGYHWFNLAIHCANVGLVYALGLLVFEDAALALALAGLWGLHPLLVDSVTNIVGRADLLAAFGVLGGLVCYLKSAVVSGRSKALWFAGLAGAQTLGIFSKESAAVLPVLMLIYDFAFAKKARWIGYAVLALPFALYLYLRAGVPTHMVIDFAENPLAAAGFWSARLTAFSIVGRYLWLFVWPARLSADYSYNAVPLLNWPPDWQEAVAILASVATVAAVVRMLSPGHRRTTRRTTRTPLFFTLFFLAALIPTSNLIVVIGSIMAERFVYLPAVGLAGCLAVAIHRLPARFRWIAAGSICLAFGARTYARNFAWHDAMSLWASAEQAYPAAARPHNNLGNALAQQPGRLDDAIAQYQAALRIRPDFAGAHYNLANAFAEVPGRLPAAIAEYREALRNHPAYIEAHINLGNALARTSGGLAAAAVEYEAALRLDPASADALYNLGNLFASMPGKLPDAIAEYRAALTADPGKVEAHIALGNALSQIPGRLPEARAEYEAAVQMDPGNAEAHYSLGTLVAAAPGGLIDAIAEYRAALTIEPGNAKVHSNLGSALSLLPGRMPEAIAEYEAALRIDPNNAEAHYNLGNALAEMPGKLPDAIAEYQAAIKSQPGFAEAHFNLGSALARTPGRIPDAIAEFETVLRIGPDPEARQMLAKLQAMRR